MATVAVKARYKLISDTVWTDLVDQAFVNGQLGYTFNVAGLNAQSDYEFQIYLGDVNNPALVVVDADVFATLAA